MTNNATALPTENHVKRWNPASKLVDDWEMPIMKESRTGDWVLFSDWCALRNTLTNEVTEQRDLLAEALEKISNMPVEQATTWHTYGMSARAIASAALAKYRGES